MNQIALTGLVKIEFPERTVLLSDGAFFIHEGDTYRSSDAVFGTIAGFDTMEEGVGDFVPAISMTLKAPGDTAPADLSKPGHQTARVRFTIAEYDVETGVISTSDVHFDGQVDQTRLVVRKDNKQLEMSVVSLAERLFERNIGNSLSPVWHKSVWPGEQGHDNATGLSVAVAWGVEKPSSGRGFGFRFSGDDEYNMGYRTRRIAY